MRNLLIFMSMSALLPATLCIAAAAWSAPERPGANRPAAGALNPARAADRQLRAYGEANPQCRMWSNWEKLCSRTGPEGAVQCFIDPGRRVSPSRPFCAVARWEGRADVPPASERVSRERFCLSRETIEARGQHLRIRVCTRHDPDRPFNGRRVAALLHPGCDGLSDAETGRPYCVRGGNAAAGLPDCASLASRRVRHDRLLVCGRWSGPALCAASPVREWRPPGPEDITFGTPDPNRTAVHGLFCQNR